MVKIHKRLLYCVNVNRTSLDHLLLGKCADVDRACRMEACRMETIITPRLLWANMEKCICIPDRYGQFVAAHESVGALREPGRFELVVKNPEPVDPFYVKAMWGNGTSNIAHLIVNYKY